MTCCPARPRTLADAPAAIRAGCKLPALRTVADRNRLVMRHFPLVVSVARKLLGDRHPGLEDAIQDGTIGLIHACETFDPALGFRPSTHLRRWILRDIHRGLRGRDGEARVPNHLWDLRARVDRGDVARAELDPSEAKALARTERAQGLRRVGEDGVLHAHWAAGGGPAGPAEACEAADELRALAGWLDRLAARWPREAHVIRRRYGLDGEGTATQEAIGEGLGVTKERARQLERAAIRRLAEYARVDR